MNTFGLAARPLSSTYFTSLCFKTLLRSRFSFGFGVIVQVLCSYSTLPLYTLVTQMGSSCKLDKVDEKAEMESSPLFHRMTKESNQHSQIGEQAIIMMEDHAISSTIELHPIIQSPLEKT